MNAQTARIVRLNEENHALRVNLQSVTQHARMMGKMLAWSLDKTDGTVRIPIVALDDPADPVFRSLDNGDETVTIIHVVLAPTPTEGEVPVPASGLVTHPEVSPMGDTAEAGPDV